VVSTYPNLLQMPKHKEASTRTPPKMRMPSCISPGQMLLGTPSGLSRAAYQTSHILLSPNHGHASPGVGSFFDWAAVTSFPMFVLSLPNTIRTRCQVLPLTRCSHGFQGGCILMEKIWSKDSTQQPLKHMRIEAIGVAVLVVHRAPPQAIACCKLAFVCFFRI